MRFWGSEKPLHADKITVWAAISSSGIFGPYFSKDSDGECVGVNEERYLNLLKRKLLPALQRKATNFSSVWYQQDGATPHTATRVLEWLDDTFSGRYLSHRTEKPWPPYSPDLNPLDFFLWGYLKDRV